MVFLQENRFLGNLLEFSFWIATQQVTCHLLNKEMEQRMHCPLLRQKKKKLGAIGFLFL